MVWTAPMTFTANTTLTAAQLNTHLRDNLMETAPAKATTPGGFFVADAENSIAERVISQENVDASEQTSSTSWTNLATVGPSLTLDTGANAIVILTCRMSNSTANACAMGVEITGASSVSPSDQKSLLYADADGSSAHMSAVHHEGGLTAGSNTFTCKYRVFGGTGTFLYRRISIIPY